MIESFWSAWELVIVVFFWERNRLNWKELFFRLLECQFENNWSIMNKFWWKVKFITIFFYLLKKLFKCSNQNVLCSGHPYCKICITFFNTFSLGWSWTPPVQFHSLNIQQNFIHHRQQYAYNCSCQCCFLANARVCTFEKATQIIFDERNSFWISDFISRVSVL